MSYNAHRNYYYFIFQHGTGKIDRIERIYLMYLVYLDLSQPVGSITCEHIIANRANRASRGKLLITQQILFFVFIRCHWLDYNTSKDSKSSSPLIYTLSIIGYYTWYILLHESEAYYFSGGLIHVLLFRLTSIIAFYGLGFRE